MRWITEMPTLYKHHDTRIKKRFLVLPKSINDETRWLEIAEWEEKFSIYSGWDGLDSWWTPLRWVNK